MIPLAPSGPAWTRLSRTVRANRYRLVAGVIAVLAGLAVFLIATDLFPYHSSNHDEGVYLQQAAMLLEGRLWLTPGSEPLREAVHPWFFVESDRGFYAKYAPVPAAIFALGELVGGYRMALVGVAVATVALTYGLGAAAFDRPTGVLAAAILAAAPLFLLSSAVFLPYAPTTALNLLFALAYVRSVRRADRRWSVLAGTAIGLAFFARPYTAVLFAAPFVVHALWQLRRAVPDDRKTVARTGTIAVVGLLFVGVTLAYNALLTGAPLRFPYEAFAPRDGLGFGRREILGYGRGYTPAVAGRTTVAVLQAFARDWFTAGALGSGAALLGGGLAIRSLRRDGLDAAAPLSDRQLQAILLGLAATVVVGNAYFWGSLNLLGDLSRGDDGLVSLFGPFYHFDLLLPAAVFAAHGARTAGERVKKRVVGRASRPRAVRFGLAVLLVGTVATVGVADAAVLRPPVERNAAYTAKFAAADTPLAAADLEDALVFLPPEYGEWRNHPFQWRRNDPGFDGPTVYVLSRTPGADFAVLDAYPDRTLYRYRYHGEWTPVATDHVVPVLERVERVEGAAIRARTSVAVPDRIVRARVGVHAGESSARYVVSGELPDRLAVNWSVDDQGVSVAGAGLEPLGEATGPVPVDGPSTVAVTVTITEPSGTTLTYREAVLVRPTAAGVEVVWPPTSTACPLTPDCGLAGTYVPDRPDTRPTGIAMNTTRRPVEGTVDR